MANTKKSRFSYVVFRILRWFLRIFYGKMKVEGTENLPLRDTVIIANHTQMNGPIACEFFLPENYYTWCAGEMMSMKEVPSYAFNDFWSQKPKRSQPFYRMLSYLIAPLAVCIFNDARTLKVYKDHRSLYTFKESINRLKEGSNLVIFPEKDEKCNNIIYEFQKNFVDVARLYYKKCGKKLTFVPMYIAPKLRTMYIGKGIEFDPDVEHEEEKDRITEYLKNEITRIAVELPLHKVIPYRNIPKKNYLTNKDVTEVPR